VGRDERRSQAAGTAAGLSLAELLDRRPAELSGGQQQRAALARAIVSRPDAFLFDEPLSNLDARLRLEARTFLKRLQRELAVTTVFVTHDQAEALALADRMAVMEAGRIRQLGTPKEVFHRPANLFVAGFIGSTPMNLLAGVVTGDTVTVAGGTLDLPAPARGLVADGEQVVLGIRPEYLALAGRPTPGSLPGTVAIVEDLGTASLVSVEVAPPASPGPAASPSPPAGAASPAPGRAAAAVPTAATAVTVAVTVPEGAEPDIGTDAWLTPAAGRALLYRAGDGELIGAHSGPARLAAAAP
jgi:multiple sugar transport system ATP-binding protein